MTQKIDWNYLFIGLLGALFYLPFLGGVHLFDWDEINFAEVSREMIVTGEYLRPQINYEAFWEKPPLFFWLQSISMHIFGVNEYAARFPNAICGILTLVLLYYFGKKIYDKTFGWLWVLSYCGAFLPHLYFKSGIIDPWFNLFIFLSYIFLIENQAKNLLQNHVQNNEEKRTSYIKHRTSIPLSILLAGVFSGLAILTKGPVGYLIVFLAWSIKTVIYREFSLKNIKHFTLFSIIALSTTLLWFGIETLRNGTWFVKTFIEYNLRLAKTEDAGHGGFFGYHFVIIFFGCFPASIFALRSLFSRYNFFGEKTDYTRSMKVLFWVVIILFSLVQSKIVHYSSMCYLPLTFLSAVSLYDFVEKKDIPFWVKSLLMVVGVLIGGIVAAVPIVGQNIEWLHEYVKGDIFVLKMLEAEVKWSLSQVFVGISFVLTFILVLFYLKKWKTNFSEPKILRGLFLFFLTTAVFLNIVLIVFINNIEDYSQNAAIGFLESKSNEDCYVTTFEYKSYANVFYAKKKKPSNPKHSSDEWLMYGNVDKPTYWMAKYPSKPRLDTMPTLQFLYEKNGFVFYQRR
jgi:4-amino-4-deoxy-L-arabinose transferase-like glycosyltransferase